MTNETQVMPAVALRGITILPDMIVHFDVSRKKSIRAIEEAMTKDQRIFLITQKDPKVEEPSEDDLYKIGTVAMIKQVAKVPKDMLRVLVEGMERAELMQLEDGTSYLEAEVDVMEQEEENLPDTVKEAMLLSMRELFSVYCKENQKMNQEQVRQTLEIDDITDLVDHIAVNIPLTFKQDRSGSLHGAGYYGTGCSLWSSRQHKLRRIFHFHQPLFTHLKDTDLIC